jgi:hypothetical protein
MKDPVRGVFRITGFYDKHPSSSPPGTRLTGVIVAPGIPATPVEHKPDSRGRWAGMQELPVLVDRTDPSRFVVLWDEVKPISWQDQALQAAREAADRINGGTPNAAADTPGASPFPFDTTSLFTDPSKVFGGSQETGFDSSPEVGFDDSPGAGFGGSPEVTFDEVVTVGPDGQVSRGTLPPEAAANIAAGVEEAVRRAFEGFGSAIPEGSAATPYGGFNPFEAARTVASQSGERATAVVIAVEDRPVRRGLAKPPGGMVDLTLEVTRADGSLYTAHTVIGFSTPQRRSIVAQVGKHLNVFIDPRTPTKVAIDTTGLF